MEETIYYRTVKDRPDYQGSDLHAFHILIEEIGVEAVINWPYKKLETAHHSIINRLCPKISERNWSADEKKFLADNYLTLTPHQIAQKIGRSIQAVKKMKAIMNLKGRMKKSILSGTCYARKGQKSQSKKSNY